MNTLPEFTPVKYKDHWGYIIPGKYGPPGHPKESEIWVGPFDTRIDCQKSILDFLKRILSRNGVIIP